MINTLAEMFKLAHQVLLKLKKNMKVYCTMRNMKYQKYIRLQTHKNIDESNKSKFTSKNAFNKTSKTYTYCGTCWKYNAIGHLAKECKNIP